MRPLSHRNERAENTSRSGAIAGPNVTAPAKVVAIDAGNHRARVLARRDDLIASTYPPGRLSLVERIARQVARSLPPSFDLEDLIGVGNIALIHAATRYRPGAHGGAPFEAYARKVIHGAILDSVRRNKYVENTRPGLEVIASNSADTEQVDNPTESPALIRAATPAVAEDAIDASRMRRRIADAASWLSPAQRAVLAAYYAADEPTFDDVATRLGISRTRTRTLHAAGIDAMRTRLKRAA